MLPFDFYYSPLRMLITRSKTRKKTEDAKDHQDKPPRVRSPCLVFVNETDTDHNLRTLVERRTNITHPFLNTHVKLGLQPSETNAKMFPDGKDQFRCQPLSSQMNEVRLLRILPNRSFDGVNCGIECKIFTFSWKNCQNMMHYHMFVVIGLTFTRSP